MTYTWCEDCHRVIRLKTNPDRLCRWCRPKRTDHPSHADSGRADEEGT